jgi:hypothetical protein
MADIRIEHIVRQNGPTFEVVLAEIDGDKVALLSDAIRVFTTRAEAEDKAEELNDASRWPEG